MPPTTELQARELHLLNILHIPGVHIQNAGMSTINLTHFAQSNLWNGTKLIGCSSRAKERITQHITHNSPCRQQVKATQQTHNL